MKFKRAAFRVDASTQIGSGHVMRCLTVAEALSLRGYECTFLMRQPTEGLKDLIARAGHKIISLNAKSAANWSSEQGPPHAHWLSCSWQEDVEEVLDVNQTPFDLFFVDHYALDHRWELAIRKIASKLVVIDDLADRLHECDFLLDQNPSIENDRYEKKVNTRCVQLLGPEYALLKKEFSLVRSSLRRKFDEVRRILVFLGSGDPNNTTEIILNVLVGMHLKNIQIDVIVGSLNPNRQELLEKFSGNNQIIFHDFVSNMQTFLSDSDICLGAAGSSSWERCCLGLPSVVVAIADNQKDIAAYSQQAGISLYAGDYKDLCEKNIEICLRKLLDSHELRKEMSARCMGLVDGNGVSRLLEKISA